MATSTKKRKNKKVEKKNMGQDRLTREQIEHALRVLATQNVEFSTWREHVSEALIRAEQYCYTLIKIMLEKGIADFSTLEDYRFQAATMEGLTLIDFWEVSEEELKAVEESTRERQAQIEALQDALDDEVFDEHVPCETCGDDDGECAACEDVIDYDDPVEYDNVVPLG